LDVGLHPLFGSQTSTQHFGN